MPGEQGSSWLEGQNNPPRGPHLVTSEGFCALGLWLFCLLLAVSWRRWSSLQRCRALGVGFFNVGFFEAVNARPGCSGLSRLPLHRGVNLLEAVPWAEFCWCCSGNRVFHITLWKRFQAQPSRGVRGLCVSAAGGPWEELFFAPPLVQAVVPSSCCGQAAGWMEEPWDKVTFPLGAGVVL